MVLFCSIIGIELSNPHRVFFLYIYIVTVELFSHRPFVKISFCRITIWILIGAAVEIWFQVRHLWLSIIWQRLEFVSYPFWQIPNIPTILLQINYFLQATNQFMISKQKTYQHEQRTHRWGVILYPHGPPPGCDQYARHIKIQN